MLSKILVPLDGSGLAERALADATVLSIPTATPEHALAGENVKQRSVW
jgi:hypothetical protein